MRKYLIAWLLLFSCPSFSQMSGLQILTESNAAIKKLKSISYSISQKEYGTQIIADITIEKDKEFPVFGVSKVKLEGMSIDKQGNQQVAFAYDGNKFEFLDAKNSQLVKLDSPDYQKLGRAGQCSICSW